jgi:SNF2 family DNA or RNA helicase
MRKKSELHGYQQQAIDFLYEHNSALALLPVGAGKSVIGWTTAQELMREGHVKRPLVLAPMRVAQLVWPQERAEWEHLKDEPIVAWGGEPSAWEDSPWKESRVLWGKIQSAESRAPKVEDVIKRREIEAKLKDYRAQYERVNRNIEKNPPPENVLHVTSYENLMWLCDLYRPGKSPFDLWIFDEIGRLKNPKSPRFKEVRKHTEAVRIVWGLNATPAPEGFEDLFTQVNIVDHGQMWGKSFYKWREKWFMPADFHGYKWKLQNGSKASLISDLNKVAFRVDESELSYQKSMQHSLIKVTLPPKARGMYQQMEKEMALSVPDADITAFSAAAACMKLRQITQGFVYDEDGKSHIIHEEKAHALADLIDELNGEPLLVAYEFIEDLEAIRKVWKNLPFLGQGVSTATAQRHVEDWNARRIPVLALHPYSAGHGLNLQHGGSHICWYALPWPLESYQQTNGRIDRQGQTRACFSHHIVAADSMDERVSAALRSKDAAQDDIIKAIRQVTYKG